MTQNVLNRYQRMKSNMNYPEFDMSEMTPAEIEELAILQDMEKCAPSVAHELFFKNNLGARFLKLKEKKLMSEMSPMISNLAKEISDMIDKDIIDSLMPIKATDPASIKKLEKLLGIDNDSTCL